MLDFLKIKKDISALGAEIKSIAERIESLKQERDSIESMPMCKSDALKILDDWVDQQAGKFPVHLRNSIEFVLRRPLKAREFISDANPINIINAARSANINPTVASIQPNIFYLLRAQIKEGIHAAVEEMDFSESGLPYEERILKLDKLDKEIASLEKKEAELLQHAHEAGIRL